MIYYRTREWCAVLKHAETLNLANFMLASVVAGITMSFTTALVLFDQLALEGSPIQNLGKDIGPYSAVTGVLGLLVPFRTSQALHRFWEERPRIRIFRFVAFESPSRTGAVDVES